MKCWARGAAVWAVAMFMSVTSCSSTMPAVDGARAHARVEKQVAFGPRIAGTSGNFAAREWIAAEATRLGGRIERQTFDDTIGTRIVTLTNLIAHYGPTSGRRIALFAHFDTRPWSDQAADTADHAKPVPGANDAGSGVAVLLEVAEVMKKSQPKVGVDLVFLDGEDLGRPTEPDEYCRGSRGYALRLPPVGNDARPVAGFLFDMVGDADLGIWDEGNSAARATNLVELVHEAAEATDAKHFNDGIKYTLIDDHVPLLDAGLPAVDIIDFDYRAWHTPADLPDQVSAASLAEVSRVAVWIVLRSGLARP